MADGLIRVFYDTLLDSINSIFGVHCTVPVNMRVIHQIKRDAIVIPEYVFSLKQQAKLSINQVTALILVFLTRSRTRKTTRLKKHPLYVYVSVYTIHYVDSCISTTQYVHTPIYLLNDVPQSSQ